MKDLLRIASSLDDSGHFILSDKLFKIAQQGRLNLYNETGSENSREAIKSLVGQSLVRNKLNPSQFIVDFEKLNYLLKRSFLGAWVNEIADIRTLHKNDPSTKHILGQWVPSSKTMYIPAVYNSENISNILHEAIHSIDPVGRIPTRKFREMKAEDFFRPYFNQRAERLAHFEDLHTFYSEEKLNKVLEIFYIKDKKKYPSKELAIKAFMSDFKNYMQNPEESILFRTSRFHSYMVAVNDGTNSIRNLILNSHKPLDNNEITSILGDVDPQSSEGLEKYIEYLRTHPRRFEARDKKYYGQLQKFFSNVYTNVAKKIMPGYEAPVMPFNSSQAIKASSAKNWLVRFISKNKNIPIEVAQQNLDYIILQRRDLYSKFLSSLRTLNIVLDESFNFQDPRWQLLEPIVELLLNELIKYMENPKQYKTNMQTDEQRTYKQLKFEIDKIINDKTILDKKAYFLEHWSGALGALKTLGTMEQNELLSKFPVVSFDKGLDIMKNIGQK